MSSTAGAQAERRKEPPQLLLQTAFQLYECYYLTISSRKKATVKKAVISFMVVETRKGVFTIRPKDLRKVPDLNKDQYVQKDRQRFEKIIPRAYTAPFEYNDIKIFTETLMLERSFIKETLRQYRNVWEKDKSKRQTEGRKVHLAE